MAETFVVHRLMNTRDPHLATARRASEERVARALEQLRDLYTAFEAARTDAGAGELTSYHPVRNMIRRDDSLKVELTTLRDGAAALAKTADAANKYLMPGASQLSIPPSADAD